MSTHEKRRLTRVPALRQRGISLVETTLVMVLLGTVLVFGWRLADLAGTRVQDLRADVSLGEADAALTGFAALHARLPCPDTDGDGLENCDEGDAVGALPWATLHLADPRLGRLRYGVYRAADALSADDRDLAVLKDRFHPLLAQDEPPVAVERPLGKSTGLDFCHALRLSALDDYDPDQLHARLRAADEQTGDTGGAKPVAYALAMPGWTSGVSENPFSVLNQEKSFAAASAPRSVTHRDRVVVRSFEQVFDALGCAGLLAGSGHAHPNAVTAQAILVGGLNDYEKQLELAHRMALAMVAAGSAKILAASGSVLKSTALTLIATSQTLRTAGALGPVLAAGAAAVAANVAALAAAIAAEAVAIAKAVLTKQKLDSFGSFAEKADSLLDSIWRNMEASDARRVH
ncbi:MAG: type II secretion system protein [Halothiobacillaceae bacterium]